MTWYPRRRRKQPTRVVQAPALRFTPAAWAKLLFLRDAGQTEIGGFGIAAGDDPLLIGDVALIRQRCSVATVEFDDEAVADYFDRQVDAGRKPEQFARVWIHTHPGDSAAPSETDEESFARVFGRCGWSVMFILARGGRSYARLQYQSGPAAAVRIPVEVDFTAEFPASDQAAWEQQYRECVVPDICSVHADWPADWPDEFDFTAVPQTQETEPHERTI